MRKVNEIKAQRAHMEGEIIAKNEQEGAVKVSKEEMDEKILQGTYQ